MPRCPYLLSQVITILSERELSIEYARQWQETEKQPTNSFLKSSTFFRQIETFKRQAKTTFRQIETIERQ